MMKRMTCLLLALVLLFSLGAAAFADDMPYCRMCGRQIPVDSNLCPYCGVAVVHMEENAAAEEKSSPAAADSTKAAFSPAAADSTKAAFSPAAADSTKAAFSPAAADSTEAASSPAAADNAAASPATAAAAAAVPGPFNSAAGIVRPTGSVVVTKSPTSESVPYGGGCLFIAHASNATSVTWYIADASASVIMLASEAPSLVSGLCVSGADTDTLYIGGIPSWMNGYQVQACFTGEGGPVYSGIANIWTYYQAPQPSCSRCCWDYPYCWHCNPYCWLLSNCDHDPPKRHIRVYLKDLVDDDD